MGTPQELGLKKGDTALSVSAWEFTNEITGSEVVDLNSGSMVHATVVKILDFKENDGVDVEIIYSTNPIILKGAIQEWSSEWWRDSFENFVGEGMEKTHRTLVGRGLMVETEKDTDGSIIKAKVFDAKSGNLIAPYRLFNPGESE